MLSQIQFSSRLLLGMALIFSSQAAHAQALLFGAHDYGAGLWRGLDHSPLELVRDQARAGARDVEIPLTTFGAEPQETWEGWARLDLIDPLQPRQYPIV